MHLRLSSLFTFCCFATVASLAAAGCSDDEKEAGVEGGPCFPNDTCNDALICRSNLCIDPDPNSNGDGDGDGTGGSQAAVDLKACFACGETACSEENDACSASTGCRKVLECWLDCADDAACQNNCDTSSVTADDLGTISAYFGCFAQECIDECAFDVGGGDGTGGMTSGGDGDGDGDGTGGMASGGDGDGDPVNLVENGNFVDELDKWNLDLQAGAEGTYSDTGGEVCVNNTQFVDELSFTLGYPTDSIYAFAVESGASYTLSYRARGYGTLETKVGQAVAPYDTIESFNEFVSSSVMTSFKHTVIPIGAEQYAGLAFNVVLDAGETICFDDVVFTKL